MATQTTIPEKEHKDSSPRLPRVKGTWRAYTADTQHLVLFFLFSALLFFLLFLLRWQYFDVSQLVPIEQHRCLTYLSEGKLYGPQPFCTQGPPYYLVLWLFKSLTPSHFQALTTIFMLLANAGIVTFLAWLVWKETGKKRFFMLLVWYTALIYYPSHRWLVITLSAGLLLLGYYAWQYQKRPVLAGMFLSLAIFTKATTATAVAVMVGWYCWNDVIELVHRPGSSSKIRVNMQPLKSLITLSGAMILTGVACVLLFPGVLVHTVYGATRSNIPYPLLKTLAIVLYQNPVGLNPFNAAPYLMLTIAIILLVRKRTLSAAMAGIGGLGTAIIISRNLPLISGSRFLMPYFLFTMLAFFTQGQMSFRKKVIFYTLVALSIFPGMVLMGLDVGKYHVRQMVERPLTMIHAQQGPVLANAWSDEQARYLMSSFRIAPASGIHAYQPPQEVDATQRTAWEHFHVVTNMTKWDAFLTAEYQAQINETAKGITEGKYSLIFIAPPYAGVIKDLVPYLQDMFFKKQTYCTQVIPYLNSFKNIISGRAAIVFFRNFDDCIAFHDTIGGYYSSKGVFDRICAWTPSYAEYIRQELLPLDMINLNATCTSSRLFDMITLYDGITQLMVADPVPSQFQEPDNEANLVDFKDMPQGITGKV